MRFLQIDFMRRRNLWFAISGAVILIGVVSLATRGLNLGIDFKGGVQITFKTTTFTPLSKVRAQTQLIGHEKDAVVQPGSSSPSGGSWPAKGQSDERYLSVKIVVDYPGGGAAPEKEVAQQQPPSDSEQPK